MFRIRHLVAFALLFCFAGIVPAEPPAIHPKSWPRVKNRVPRNAKIEGEVDRLLRRMSVEEKVGQVIQPSITAITPADVRAYHFGSVLNGGGGWPGDVRKATPKEWLALADSFYEASVDTSAGKTAIPVIWGADAVHGHNNIVGATLFPHNIGLGATRDYELVRRVGEITAAEMKVTGLDWNFSPTVAVARDDRWGRSYESYSEEPEVVRACAAKMIEGLQGKPGTGDFFGSGKVIATAKHFLGDGGTEGGKDQGDNLSTEIALRDIHAAGYVGAMSSGVQAVMASYSSWHGRKMHGNKELLTDVLKDRMGFDGLIVGDWNGHGQVPGCTNKSCAEAFNAGIDMFMVPEDWKALYENTLAQVRSGEIPMARLDDAVRRILRVKMRAGLFAAGKPSQRPTGGRLEEIGSAAHREVARQAVRESLVLLKNNGGVLPLTPKQNVLVAGDGADNIAKQTGGWTLSWQGDGNTNADFPGATSIWDGIRSAVEAGGGRATIDANGAFSEKPDVAIVVFGENPYAEFQGDRKTLVYQNAHDLELLRELKSAEIPVVSVFLSGRPLWVNPYLNNSDAFVAAWLPGTEGAGVADVLFKAAEGSPRYDFRGKLSFSWPKLPTQTVLNRGDAGYDPLFAFGYGLTYGDKVEVPQLSADLTGVAAVPVNAFFAGEPVEPYQLYIAEGDGPALRIAGTDRVATSGGAIALRVAERPGAPAGREVQWSGKRAADVFLQTFVPVDLSRESNANLALSMNVMQRSKPVRPVFMSIGCGGPCAGRVDVTPLLREIPTGEWKPIRVRLRCFADGGADMTRIDTPFKISTDGELSLSFADVELVPATEGQVSCPPVVK